LMTPVEQIPIQVETLDAYCRDTKVEYVDLLKMDVQGFELRVLHGATEFLAGRKIGVIYTEVLFEPLYEGQPPWPELYSVLTHHGFQLIGLYAPTRSSRHAIRWCDILFLNPEARRTTG